MKYFAMYSEYDRCGDGPTERTTVELTPEIVDQLENCCEGYCYKDDADWPENTPEFIVEAIGLSGFDGIKTLRELVDGKSKATVIYTEGGLAAIGETKEAALLAYAESEDDEDWND